MIAALRGVRLSWLQFAVVAAIAGIATALIITTALGRTAAQSAAIAALHRRPLVVRTAAVSPRPGVTPVAAAAASGAGSGSPPPLSSSSSGAAGSSASTSSAPAGSGSGSGGGSASTTTTTTTTSSTGAAPKRKIGHVFVIALSTTSFEAAFGAHSVARYLNRTLRPRGTFLGGYETLGRSELPDYLAMISGQAPNPDTFADCATYAEFPSNTNPAAGGQVPGEGCVYPNTVITLADQVNSSAHTWKAYIEDMGKTNCVHPNSDATDDGPLPGADAQYATRHNPFIYFHSLLDLGGCASDDVSLDHLSRDLQTASRTPTLSFIAPRACDDASATSCPDAQPAGLGGEDSFLHEFVPRILSSAAYKRDGVLIITFALAAPAAAPGASLSTPGSSPGSGGPVPTGALVLSQYATAGKTIATTYNPYSVLRSIENLLGLRTASPREVRQAVYGCRAAGSVSGGSSAVQRPPSAIEHNFIKSIDKQGKGSR